MSKKINLKKIALVYILISFIILPFARFVLSKARTLKDCIIPGISIIIVIYGVYRLYKIVSKNLTPKDSGTFGKARFSQAYEVIKTGLQGNGIVFGKMGRKLITKPPTIEGHTLVVGGTGTGKSRGVVIPTLLMWEGSAIVMDIKREISNITSSKREQKGNKIYIFDPEEEEGACYDPIKLCDTVDNAQDLARSLIPLPQKGTSFQI